MFRGLGGTEKSTILNRSIKMFTLSGISNSTQGLLSGIKCESLEEKVEVATEYWSEVATNIEDWQLAKQRKVSSADLRRDYIHAHTLALAALGRVGNSLLSNHRRGWKTKLKKLRSLDWSRDNSKQRERREMNAGTLSKRKVNNV